MSAFLFSPRDKEKARQLLCHLGDFIRDTLVRERRRTGGEGFANIAAETAADTIYEVDKITEDAICEWFTASWPPEWRVEVVMEGIEDNEPLTFPAGTPVKSTLLKCIIDPIDGTRGIMYDKRPAWALMALAPQKGKSTRLGDLVVASMTELPTSKQWRADQISAVRGCGPQGIVAEAVNILDGSRAPIHFTPSRATTFKHGFASLVRFFPEGKALTAQIEEALWEELYGLGLHSAPLVFDDQYICCGGQFYEILAGHDRMIGDLRPYVYRKLGLPKPICCHPYDVCTALILQEAGALVENPLGGPMDGPLDTTSNIPWIAFANETLAAQIRPRLQKLIAKHLLNPLKISSVLPAGATASAPGRMDFLGGVADYSGAWVLQMPISAQTEVTVSPTSDLHLHFHSESQGDFQLPWPPLLALLQEDAPPAALRDAAAPVPSWVRYPLGCLLLACRAKNWFPEKGLSFRIRSAIPGSMGVSSSAALEVATLRALSLLGGLEWTGTELARLAQQAENLIVGAPCGLMDQLACAHGRPGALLPILCQPDILGAPVPLPPDLIVAGWPSGVRHDIGASPYHKARTAAFMGRRMIEDKLGHKIPHLAAVTPSTLAALGENFLPTFQSGKAFLDRYEYIDDTLTHVNEKNEYPVRAAARFPIEESLRARLAASLLPAVNPDNRLPLLTQIGELLLQSHAAYSNMGLGSPETDRMIAKIMQLGPQRGLYGARVSGGGSGGTVVVLLEKSALPLLEDLARHPVSKRSPATPIIL